MTNGMEREANGVFSTSNVGEALDRIGLTRAHKTILLLILTGGFFNVFEQSGAAVTGPSLQAVWGLSDSQVALVATATFIAMVVGGLVAGVVADRAGRKALFTASLLIYTLTGLVCAFAPNYEVLLAGRVVMGLGLGGLVTIALPFLSELMPTKFRGTAVSLFNMGAGGLGNPAAFIFGALLLGPLAPLLGGDDVAWRWYFGLLALPAMLFFGIRRKVPESPSFLVSQGRVNDANYVLSRLADGDLSSDPVVTHYLSHDAVVLDDTKGKATSVKAGVTDIFCGRLLRNTLSLGVGSFMSFGGQIAILTLMPIILVSRGHSISGSLSFTAVMQGGALLGTVVASWLNHRFPRRAVMTGSAVLAAICGVGFAALGTSLVGILVFGALFNFFVLLCNTTVWAWAPELYPTRVRGTGVAVIVNSGNLGQAMIPLIAAAIYAATGVGGLFTMVAGMYILLGILAFLAPETFGRNLEELHGET